MDWGSDGRGGRPGCTPVNGRASPAAHGVSPSGQRKEVLCALTALHSVLGPGRQGLGSEQKPWGDRWSRASGSPCLEPTPSEGQQESRLHILALGSRSSLVPDQFSTLRGETERGFFSLEMNGPLYELTDSVGAAAAERELLEGPRSSQAWCGGKQRS